MENNTKGDAMQIDRSSDIRCRYSVPKKNPDNAYPLSLEEQHMRFKQIESEIKSYCKRYVLPIPRINLTISAELCDYADVCDYVDIHEIKVNVSTDIEDLSLHARRLFAHYLGELHTVGGFMSNKIANIIAELLQ